MLVAVVGFGYMIYETPKYLRLRREIERSILRKSLERRY